MEHPPEFDPHEHDDDEPDEGPPDTESSGLWDDAGAEPSDEDAIALDALTSQLRRLGGTAVTTLRVKRVRPRKLADGTPISGFLIGFEFEPPYRPVEIMERLGRELGTGTYKLVAVNGEGQYVKGGTSAPIEILAGASKQWTPPDERDRRNGGELLDERSIAYKVLLRTIEGNGGSEMSGVAELLREQLRAAESKATKLENQLDAARRSERELETKVTKLEGDVERGKDKAESAKERYTELKTKAENLERDLRDATKDNEKLEREVAKLELSSKADGPLEQLGTLQKLGLLGNAGQENPSIELYQQAMAGLAEEMPKIISSVTKMHGGGEGGDRFTSKDIVEIADKALDVFGKRAEARLGIEQQQAQQQQAAAAEQQRAHAYRVEMERRRLAAGGANGAPAPPPRRSRPVRPGAPGAAPGGLPGAADPLASPGDAERAAEAAATRPGWLGTPGREPEPRPATATVHPSPGAAAAPAPAAIGSSDPTQGFVHPEFLEEIERHVAAGMSGATLASVVDGWQEKNDPRGGVVHEILLQACIDAPYDKVLVLAQGLATGRLKELLDSDAGQKWFREWCAFWNPEGNPGVLEPEPSEEGTA
jgi:hypothetical protein